MVTRAVSALRSGAQSVVGDGLAKTKAAASKAFVMKFKDFSFSLKASIAEFFAMMLFVYFGCASATMFSASTAVGGVKAFEQATGAFGYQEPTAAKFLASMQLAGSWGIVVALTFGLGIVVVVYCVAHVSGGQVNPIVSSALFLTGRMGPVQLAGNITAQILGSILGAAFLKGTVPNHAVSSLGSNSISPTFSTGQALLGEIIMSSILVFTVLQTACEPRSIAKNMAPLAIGLSVFLAHCVLLPIDGCSINPARSLGPAILSGSWNKFWVFVVGPFVGCVVGVINHWILWFDWDPQLGYGKKKSHTNEVSNDNCGLSDAALRIGC